MGIYHLCSLNCICAKCCQCCPGAAAATCMTRTERCTSSRMRMLIGATRMITGSPRSTLPVLVAGCFLNVHHGGLTVLESRYLTTVSSLPRQVATFLGRLDTVVKYLDSNKSWVPGVGVVSPTASPASVDANPTNATARLT